jgi:anthranilate synthase
MDRKKEQIERYRYDFEREGVSTRAWSARPNRAAAARAAAWPDRLRPHGRKSTWPSVEKVREGMRRGDYYEVVLRQTFSTPYSGKASDLFERVQRASPSPYEFLLQFGDEQLIGASPEMFVRVEGQRVETCPIAGTARRTGDPCATPITSANC